MRQPNGEVAREAFINCKGAKQHSDLPWSVDNSTVSLAPGTYEISATMGRRREYKSNAEKVTISEREAPPAVELRLAGRSGIRGKVRFPEDEPESDAWIGLAVASEATSASGRGRADSSHLQSVTSEGLTAFGFMDIAPGNYRVEVTRQYQGVPDAVVDVELASEIREIEVVLPPLTRDDCSVLWAVDSEGDPIRKLSTLSFSLRAENNARSGGIQLVRKRDGSYWFPAKFLEGETDPNVRRLIAEASLELSIQSEFHGTKTFLGKYGEPREYKLTFAAPAALTVQVAGYAPESVEGVVSVTLRRSPLGDSGENDEMEAIGPAFMQRGHSATVAADGSAELGPVEAGEYVLVLLAGREGPWESTVGARLPVSLAPGANTASITMLPFYSIAVRCKGTEKSAQLQLHRIGDAPHRIRHSAPDEDGVAAFKNLLPGEYFLTSSGDKDEGVMSLRIPGPAEFEFEPAPIRAFRVSISRSDGALARAGFADGDLIIAIDGTEFENRRKMLLVYAASMEKESCKFTVLRQDSRIEIPISPMELENYSKLGGSLVPAASVESDRSP